MPHEVSKNNPLLCDIETGMCDTTEENSNTPSKSNKQSKEKSVKLIYYTDPICSSCWGVQPQLRKLKLEYGNAVEIDYRMGGLLADWNYSSGGISGPADVASHWEEVSIHYEMPIDGDLWLENPMDSSYPSSIALKAAQLQDSEKAVLYMREMREMMFFKKKNMAKRPIPLVPPYIRKIPIEKISKANMAMVSSLKYLSVYFMANTEIRDPIPKNNKALSTPPAN